MSFFSSLFKKNTKQEEPVEEIAAPTEEEATAGGVTPEEEKLLAALEEFNIVEVHDEERNFLRIKLYRFEKPFTGHDMSAIVKGIRWLGFKMYGFDTVYGEKTVTASGWEGFHRSLLEDDPDSCVLICSFCGVRVNCTVARDGYIQMGHDQNKPVDLTPFEELFSPVEVTEEKPEE